MKMMSKTLLVVGASVFTGAAMAADGAVGFDVAAFIGPVSDTIKANVPVILTAIAGIFAVVWGATSGVTLVKRFLGKVVG